MNILEVLLEQGYELKEAQSLIAEAREELNCRLDQGDMEGAYDVCKDYFGLEPDYLINLMGY